MSVSRVFFWWLSSCYSLDNLEVSRSFCKKRDWGWSQLSRLAPAGKYGLCNFGGKMRRIDEKSALYETRFALITIQFSILLVVIICCRINRKKACGPPHPQFTLLLKRLLRGFIAPLRWLRPTSRWSTMHFPSLKLLVVPIANVYRSGDGIVTCLASMFGLSIHPTMAL